MTTESKGLHEHGHDVAAGTDNKRRILRQVLAINLVQSVGGIAVGVLAASTALIGAGLDNLADASVYAVALYAVGRPVLSKVRAARLSGWLLLGFAAVLMIEVLRRFVQGADPGGLAMIAMAAINAVLNQVCLRLLARHRDDDVSFSASSIFTSNDTWANLGIVVSGLLVLWFDSPLPDLVIGLIVAIIAFRGGLEILKQAREAQGATRAGVSHD